MPSESSCRCRVASALVSATGAALAPAEAKIGSSSGKGAAKGAAGVETDVAVERISVPLGWELRSCAAGGCTKPRYLEIDSPGSNIGWYPAGGPNCWVLPDS